jgi:hypothetical protein
MSDKYNQTWARAFGLWRFKRYAVTIGQTTYYSCSKEDVDARPTWRKHEEEHKKQWAQEGFVKFLCKYIYYSIRYGYTKNPYEVQAEEAAKK